MEVCPDIELQGFVEGCQTVVKMAKDIDISDVLVIPMERIVTDMDYFSYVAKKLTGDMCYFSEELLTRIFNIGNINSHQKQLKKIRKDLNREVLKTPELVWASWKGLKQEIFHAMVGKKELVKFEALGYNFSFL
ncbi:MAG: hypothetical protein ACD_19C00171G0001 [uncultured bacterium]|nr:MAG: hypothetical protein ACD_19C00171G0001 [uncultured bacterium]